MNSSKQEDSCGHADHHCGCITSSSVTQSLNELQFERGLWGAAFDGNIQKVCQLLEKGCICNIVDSSGYTALVG